MVGFHGQSGLVVMPLAAQLIGHQSGLAFSARDRRLHAGRTGEKPFAAAGWARPSKVAAARAAAEVEKRMGVILREYLCEGSDFKAVFIAVFAGRYGPSCGNR